jgi:hypothetical protein
VTQHLGRGEVQSQVVGAEDHPGQDLGAVPAARAIHGRDTAQKGATGPCEAVRARAVQLTRPYPDVTAPTARTE